MSNFLCCLTTSYIAAILAQQAFQIVVGVPETRTVFKGLTTRSKLKFTKKAEVIWGLPDLADNVTLGR